MIAAVPERARVVFLDFDGVLNHHQMAHEMNRQHVVRECPNTWETRHAPPRPGCRCYSLSNQLDRACVARVNALCERGGAVVCVSSSWRQFLSAAEIDSGLASAGFTGTIVGVTPFLPLDPAWERYHAAHLDPGAPSTTHNVWARGWEIHEWLREHRDRVERFVVLDDCNDMARLAACLVQTDDRWGLDDQDVEVALQKLGRPSERVMQVIREEPWRSGWGSDW